jgi:hypothetical protein
MSIPLAGHCFTISCPISPVAPVIKTVILFLFVKIQKVKTEIVDFSLDLTFVFYVIANRVKQSA